MSKSETKKLCFVIMPFDEQRLEVFEFGITPACQTAGFEAVRVDQLKGHFNINRKIIEHIFNCTAVIAEITDKNPNVFYEMGVAHAIGNKTIMIAQNAQDLPFDIRNYRCIIYQQSVKGLQQLQKEIVTSLLELEKWSQQPSNPAQDFKPFEAFVPNAKLDEYLRQLREKEERLRASVPKSDLEKLERDYQRLQSELAAKEQLLKNAAIKTDIEVMQAQLVQKAAENDQLKRELKQLRLQPNELKLKSPKLQLRLQPLQKLSDDEVKRILEARNLFDSRMNKNGKGIAHEYEVRERKGEKVVLDYTMGLMWPQSAPSYPINYNNAEKYIREFNTIRFVGYGDWRLPTLEEALSLMEPRKNDDLYLAPLFDHAQKWIWTADKYSSTLAWYVDFRDGYCGHFDIENSRYLRAMRSVRKNE